MSVDPVLNHVILFYILFDIHDTIVYSILFDVSFRVVEFPLRESQENIAYVEKCSCYGNE